MVRRILLVGVWLAVLNSFSAHATPIRPATATTIEQGVSYFSSSPDKVSALQWLLLDYLSRKYRLDSSLSIAQRKLVEPEGNQNQAEFEVWKRIAYPKDIVKSLPLNKAVPFSRMVMIAMYCDHIAKPPDFNGLVRRNVFAGGYDLTHAAFSLERMRENGCSLYPAQDRLVRWQIANRMGILVTARGTTPDLRYEAIAMLLEMGRRDMVQPAWISQIMAEQQPDGGWRAETTDATSNDHATMLAMWALLAYSRPAVPNQPMIRHSR